MTSQVFEKVTAKLDAMPGLGDRVQLFLMADPTPLTPEEVTKTKKKKETNYLWSPDISYTVYCPYKVRQTTIYFGETEVKRKNAENVCRKFL